MARKTIELPTTQEIEQLFREGNIEQLRHINERLAKTANQRMQQLYKSNVNTPALERARYYIEQESEVASGEVFSRSKKIEAEDLVDQIKEELIFLRSKSSTVSGSKDDTGEKVFETLTQGKLNEDGTRDTPYLDLSEFTPPSGWKGNDFEYFKKRFTYFLSSDVWKDIKKHFYVTTNNKLLTETGEAIAMGASISEILSEYKRFLRNEITLTDMWDQFTSIKKQKK